MTKKRQKQLMDKMERILAGCLFGVPNKKQAEEIKKIKDKLEKDGDAVVCFVRFEP